MSRDAERILYVKFYLLWLNCPDDQRRARYWLVLDKHRDYMRRLGFSDAMLRVMEQFALWRMEAAK